MSSDPLPHQQIISGTSATNGGQAIAGVVHGNVYNFGPDGLFNRLPYAVEAPFNSYQRRHEPTCLQDTRVELLQDIYNWAVRHDERCIFWLNGLAGTGKSTIARTVARTYSEQQRLGASFFLSRGGGDVGHAGKFVTSIALQLAISIPASSQDICEAITERWDIASKSLRDQWQQLVRNPLSKLDGNGSQSLYVLVVDALDECDNENDIRIVLDLLAKARSLERVRLRVFLTSKPEISIRHGFGQMLDSQHQEFILHNISPSIVDDDISLFFKHNLALIVQERSLNSNWPGQTTINHLVQNASGLFIWAATACRFIREGFFVETRLSILLEGGSSTASPEEHLNGIYIAVLRNTIRPEYLEQETQRLYGMLRDVLGTIVVLFSPLSTNSLCGLLGIAKQDLGQVLMDSHAILDIPKDQRRPIHLHHPSFRDFLLNKDRCKDPNFWVNEKQAHQTLADSCIRLMSTSLKQDICGLDAPGRLVSDVESGRVEQCLSPEVQYACLYWVQHLQKSGAQLRDNDQVHLFLQEHLLHWLEALGWMRKLPEGIYAIVSLEALVFSADCSQISELIHDSKRFILYHRPGIEQAPLQVYCSALMFTPTMSLVRKQFINCKPKWFHRLPDVENNWNALLQTLEGHTGSVNAVAFSTKGKLLASASDDKTIKLWDTVSGVILQTFEGHSNPINAVVFSSEDQLLASASDDKTIILWDAGLGVALKRLEGHKGAVKAVTFSTNGKLLASASCDGTVKLWDADSWAILHTFQGHLRPVNAVIFAPDGRSLASASDDKTIKLWDTVSMLLLRTLEGHSDDVRAVAFSPDGKMLASASYDKTFRLWDARSASPLQIIRDLGYASDVAFLPDGKQLASVSDNNIVKVWDTTSGVILRTFESHPDTFHAVACSPDGRLLASASYKQTVKLWDSDRSMTLPPRKSPEPAVRVVVFSPDGKLLASATDDDVVKLWDYGSGATLHTLEGHSNFVNALTFAPDGKLLASASADKTIQLWHVDSGMALQTLKGHSHYVNAAVFSPDQKLLASASSDLTVKLWDTALWVMLYILRGHESWVNAVAFSPDGQLLASASKDGTAKLWDVNSGVMLKSFKFSSCPINAVALSPDLRLLASAFDDKTVRLWDASSGKMLQTIEANAAIKSLSFSNDGRLLQTNRGPLPTTVLPDRAPTSQCDLPCSIYVKDQWISIGMENILWLPPDYRPSEVAIQGGLIAFGPNVTLSYSQTFIRSLTVH